MTSRYLFIRPWVEWQVHIIDLLIKEGCKRYLKNFMEVSRGYFELTLKEKVEW